MYKKSINPKKVVKVHLLLTKQKAHRLTESDTHTILYLKVKIRPLSLWPEEPQHHSN